MRSVKLLVAIAAVAALVAGPVLAQEMAAPATNEMAPAADAGKTTMTKKHTKKHAGKKHHAKKPAADSSMMAPAK